MNFYRQTYLYDLIINHFLNAADAERDLKDVPLPTYAMLKLPVSCRRPESLFLRMESDCWSSGSSFVCTAREARHEEYRQG